MVLELDSFRFVLFTRFLVRRGQIAATVVCSRSPTVEDGIAGLPKRTLNDIGVP